jgi:type IV pilus assembly protein PilX
VVLLGNLGFKRDLVNQSEIAVQKVTAVFNTGGLLATSTSRLTNLQAVNYSACVLPSDSRGIPLLLEDTDANFGGTFPADLNVNPACATAVATTSNDITNLLGISIRYVVDRLCTDTQIPSATNCVTDNLGHDQGGSNNEQKPGGGPSPIYRISIRVRGPHNTATYVQSTIND